jgi:hypothetical protein
MEFEFGNFCWFYLFLLCFVEFDYKVLFERFRLWSVNY